MCLLPPVRCVEVKPRKEECVGDEGEKAREVPIDPIPLIHSWTRPSILQADQWVKEVDAGLLITLDRMNEPGAAGEEGIFFFSVHEQPGSTTLDPDQRGSRPLPTESFDLFQGVLFVGREECVLVWFERGKRSQGYGSQCYAESLQCVTSIHGVSLVLVGLDGWKFFAQVYRRIPRKATLASC